MIGRTEPPLGIQPALYEQDWFAGLFPIEPEDVEPDPFALPTHEPVGHHRPPHWLRARRFTRA